MITISNLTKRYGKIVALNQVSFTFENSQVIAIMGENGAGKSTLLKICAGILPFNQGEVIIDNYSLTKDSIEARTHIGYLPEMPELYDRLTGREFLFYIASLRKLAKASQIITELTDITGIKDFLDYELGSYSKGMKQKISLISAMMHAPKNLLLDEPVYGLDPPTSRTIQDFIRKRQGTTIIATHSTRLVEQVADVVYILMRGNVVLCDKVQTLLKKYQTIENAYFRCKDLQHA